MKIAVVGGGSTYTPELVSGLTRLDVDELVLEDVDPERREVVGGMAARMLMRQGFDGSLEVTGDLDSAVEGADYVLIQIRVGGQEARLRDETAPLACARLRRRTPGSSTSRTRSGSWHARCSTRAIERSACATSRSAFSGASPAGSASSPAAWSSTRSA